MRVLYFILSVWWSVSWAQKADPLVKKIREFEAYILKAQQEWEVPGLAVTVVKDGRILLSRGYGVREIGKPDPVNEETLFACASTTKAMVAACMGILVDEGKVKWDDRVIDYLPDFQLHDPYVTRELRIRDLFIHNSGLGNADFLWSMMDIPTEEVLYRMRLIAPAYSLRSGFIYQNIFYAAAGEVITKISATPWHVFLRERLFKPLGMTRTYPLLQQVQDPNQSRPHFKIDGDITVIEHMSADRIGAAGSVWSCIQDMSKWVMCMLDSGKYPGGRLLSPSTWAELFRPQTIVSAGQFYPTARLTQPNWTTYAMGWFQHDYKGKKVNFHTGSLAGAIALHAQLPEEKMGIYIFGNLDHAEVRHALMYKAFDVFALGGGRDWSSEILQLYAGLRAQEEQKEKEFEQKRVEGTKPALTMEAYTGTYSSPLYGTLVITQENNSLLAILNHIHRANLTHWHYEVFRGWFDKKWYGKVNLIFKSNAEGSVVEANFRGMEFKKITR
jgi:CubicO group peptidase (beta-lactamase class C family)